VVHQVERLVADALCPAGARTAVRCRVRAAGVVIELDDATLSRLDGDAEQGLLRQVHALLERAGIGQPVSFAAYRAGSAFLLPT